MACKDLIYLVFYIYDKRVWKASSFVVCSLVNKIQVIKGLEDVTLCEKEAWTFEVILSHAYVRGTWTRNGLPFKSKPTCRITTQGKRHTLTLTRVSLVDMGLISFQAEGVETSANLTVTGNQVQRCLLNLMYYNCITGQVTLHSRLYKIIIIIQ